MNSISGEGKVEIPRHVATLVVLLAIAGCAADAVQPTPAAVALAVITEPSNQAQSGVPLAAQPVVELRDANGGAVVIRGILVSASIATGGGTLTGTTALRTDANGRAAFTDLALAGAVGARTLRFTSANLTPAVSGSITLSAGNPAALTPVAGNNQTAPAGTAVAVAPAVQVADGAGNPVTGMEVTFQVTGGGGAITGATPTTGADGIARVDEWRLGQSIGPNQLEATVGGISLTFSATGIVGPPSGIVVVEGAGQSAVIGSLVPIAPAVKVTDAFGNPIVGVTITFAVATGGGSLTGASPLSDASGVARAGGWMLGLLPGSQTVTASRTGLTPATLTATATDFPVVSIAAGGFTSCARNANGSAFCWGANASGQLGDGTLAPRSLPGPVQGAIQFTAVAVGPGHACAIAAGGQAYCWGNNLIGQLGDGTGVDRATPAPVLGGQTFSEIAVGDVHTCALDGAGAAWCWGSNASGRLGDGTIAFSPTPVAVQGGHAFTRIRAGAGHSCGLRNDGQILCWGNNNAGQLGDGTTSAKLVPTAVQAAGGFSDVTVGALHSCGIDGLGNGFCWGAGNSGALGTGTNALQVAPTAVAGGHQFTVIDAGTNHTCGITTAALVLCWGANGSGRLGDGTVTTRLSPTATSGNVMATELALGQEHSCARTTAGSAVCWGANASGQLGDNTTTPKQVPAGVTPP